VVTVVVVCGFTGKASCASSSSDIATKVRAVTSVGSGAEVRAAVGTRGATAWIIWTKITWELSLRDPVAVRVKVTLSISAGLANWSASGNSVGERVVVRT